MGKSGRVKTKGEQRGAAAVWELHGWRMCERSRYPHLYRTEECGGAFGSSLVPRPDRDVYPLLKREVCCTHKRAGE